MIASVQANKEAVSKINFCFHTGLHRWKSRGRRLTSAAMPDLNAMPSADLTGAHHIGPQRRTVQVKDFFMEKGKREKPAPFPKVSRSVLFQPLTVLMCRIGIGDQKRKSGSKGFSNRSKIRAKDGK